MDIFESNEDNYIILTFSREGNYRVMNLYYSGKQDKASYLIYKGEKIDYWNFTLKLQQKN